MTLKSTKSILKFKKIASDVDKVFHRYKHLGSLLEKYPLGSCHAASELFGLALLIAGYNKIQLAYNGTRNLKNGSFHSHAWLELNDTIIDLTLYQFNGVDKGVYVGDITEWHKKFKRQERRNIEKAALDHWRPSILKIDELFDDIYNCIDTK